MSANSFHHVFSPSSLRRRELCPGSFRMENGLSEDRSEYAEMGSILHHAVETGDFMGVSKDDADLVFACMGFERGRTEGASYVGHEEPLIISDGEGNILSQGTADVVAFWKDDRRAAVIDWKFGWNKVEDGINNIQMAAYALGAMQKFGCSSVDVVVYQPRLMRAKPEGYTFTKPREIYAYIDGIINNCLVPGAPIICGPEQCKYCKAKNICPALTATANEIVIAFGDMEARVEDGVLTPGILSEYYKKSKVVELAMQSIKSKVIKYMEDNGGACGELSFKYKSGNSIISDVRGAFARLKDAGMSAEVFLSCCSPSVAKLRGAYVDMIKEACVKSGIKSPAKREIEDEFNTAMDGIIEKLEDKREIVILCE